jgi:hypothetical protein
MAAAPDSLDEITITIIIIIIIIIIGSPNALQLFLCCLLTQFLYVPITADVKNDSVCLTKAVGYRKLEAKFDGTETKGTSNNKVYEHYQPNGSNSHWIGKGN